VSDEAIEKGIELAAELRAIAQELTDRDVDAGAAAAALELARAMRAHLQGERRPRWYEAKERPPFGSTTFGPFDTLSPVRGLLNPVAPPLRIELGERADGTRCVIGHARLPQVFEGPPHGVHGGIVAAMFDEILGSAQGLAPPPGVTARLEVNYHQLTPIDEDLRFEAWLTQDRGRRVFAEATCHAGETLTARATGFFMRVDFKAVEERMNARAEGEEG
jgi:acyl-coenzyme A thioesterase PaaI-like protein